jgi:hypothetical protein
VHGSAVTRDERAHEEVRLGGERANPVPREKEVTRRRAGGGDRDGDPHGEPEGPRSPPSQKEHRRQCGELAARAPARSTQTPKEAKEETAYKLGANAVVVSTVEPDMKARAGTLDFILSTIPQSHDANPYLTLLRRDGIYAVVGCIAPLSAPLDLARMVPDRKSLVTSLIGSIAETQEVLDFCAHHQIVSAIEIIPIDKINEAFTQVDEGDVAFRYVIDMSTIHGTEEDSSLLGAVGL